MRKVLTSACVAATVLMPTPGGADDAKQVTTTPSHDVGPTWSPDGSSIAFYSSGNLWVIPSNGGTATAITVGRSFLAESCAWSPDGSKIAVSMSEHISAPGGFHISTVTVSDGSIHYVTSAFTTGGDNRWPSWSPDGAELAFTRLTGPYSADIWVIPSEGGNPSQITTETSRDEWPSWSPDGSTIAFASRRTLHRTGNWDIWVVPAAGGSATQVTSNPADDILPAWSPDGSSMAFTSSRSGTDQIWIIPTTGGTPIQVTNDPGSYAYHAAWSPDGKQIAFVSNRAGNDDIWVIPVPTTAVQSESWSSVKEKYKE